MITYHGEGSWEFAASFNNDGTGVPWKITYELPRIHFRFTPFAQKGIGVSYFEVKGELNSFNPKNLLGVSGNSTINLCDWWDEFNRLKSKCHLLEVENSELKHKLVADEQFSLSNAKTHRSSCKHPNMPKNEKVIVKEDNPFYGKKK